MAGTNKSPMREYNQDFAGFYETKGSFRQDPFANDDDQKSNIGERTVRFNTATDGMNSERGGANIFDIEATNKHPVKNPAGFVADNAPGQATIEDQL